MPARATSDAPSDATVPGARFAAADEPARLAVLVVTYNSAHDVGRLLASLRPEVARVPSRVLVADNASTDDTLDRLADHPDVRVVPTGGNLGYAGGINTLLPLVGDVEAVLVLNPDLVVRPGALSALLACLADPGVGAVVPSILEPDGTPYPSLRREPTVLRTLGDALVGRRWPGRPSWASETDRTPAHYTSAHAVEWATGAALLVRATTARTLGPWDERYFLYSEETDYCRRLRGTGQQVWFEPAAQVVHSRGGSGSSPALVALQEANRVRYARAHGSPLHAQAVRGVLLLKSGLRVRDAGHRAALRSLLDGAALARPHRPPVTSPRPGATRADADADGPSGSVVIPAHDEAAVIARTLAPLAEDAAAGRLEVVVVCNGCTDATAEIARSVPGVQVVEIDVASKPAALRAGDAAATRFPRLYLDADIESAPGAVAALFAALSAPGVHAARPTTIDDLAGATWPVRSFYRLRGRIPALHEHLWGAGAYALDATVRARLGAFPDVTADDLWVDQHVAASEKTRVPGASVIVRRPRDTRSLLAVLRRTRRTDAPAEETAPPVDEGSRTIGPSDIARTVRGPRSLVDAIVYVTLVTLARAQLRRAPARRWERDTSSRR
ncbi:glycosyltransferase [Cellulomonas soli]|uniref:Glycosyltransferase 2-like domain-containing protein n=1 Tax=Cellulomonas soli TaxID=931535 RepID=A0A512PH23_9CELL|nr:glycosyltransferase [Cellulomonas soli]NYI59712.1 GT2 family glycosyltransferase [Cellulomonas soli]GEP70506.1 hypothetical protein CSO01_32210 [Cellulomonas soli]